MWHYLTYYSQCGGAGPASGRPTSIVKHKATCLGAFAFFLYIAARSAVLFLLHGQQFWEGDASVPCPPNTASQFLTSDNGKGAPQLVKGGTTAG